MIELAIRVVVSLGVVLGLLWALTKMGPGRTRRRQGSVLNVVGRQSLSRTSSISVVTVADRVLVLGVTDNTVSLLTELSPDALPEPAPAAAAVPATGTPAGITAPTTVAAHRAADSGFAAVLQGSLLSAQTWRQTVGALRARPATGGSVEES